MLISYEEVFDMTGRDVDLDNIAGAQSLIEIYVGRTEADVDDPRDRALLARAVAFQAAYMQNQESMIYEQAAVKSITVGGTAYSFPEGGTDLLWLSPIAKTACAKLSWTRSRSVKTGRLGIPETRLLDWWTED